MPRNVARTVTVAVGERAWIDLVDHRRLPPVGRTVNANSVGLCRLRDHTSDPSTGTSRRPIERIDLRAEVGPGRTGEMASLGRAEDLPVGKLGKQG